MKDLVIKWIVLVFAELFPFSAHSQSKIYDCFAKSSLLLTVASKENSSAKTFSGYLICVSLNQMKTLGAFINKKTLARGKFIDQQSVFYVFQLIIKDEYGKQGIENIVPIFFKDKKIFIKTIGSNWANEVLARKKQIIARVNSELGGEEIADLVMSN